MLKIDGKQIAQQIIEQLKNSPSNNKKLVAILVGDDPASLSFLRQKGKFALEIGINFEIKSFPGNSTAIYLKDQTHQLAAAEEVGGIIVQLPLPKHLTTKEILDIIPVKKDVDVLSTEARRLFEIGESRLLPPAVGAVEAILRSQNFDLQGKTVAVVGLGKLVGQPIVSWLKDKAELVTIDQDDDINQISYADLVICGAGVPKLINPNLLPKESAVIDFGYGKVDGTTSGDLDTTQESNLEHLSFYTPTPGGTGPILVAKLLENFLLLNQ